ncbi:hypothetical protein [Sphingomonas sp. SUN039]|uniref:hypothetical protein n=1 Tax=Sphingomonas sp. SUN039 TaxID=2937787 RepID=UPI002164298A|nr:hypothetical protein [Sphingomonas sp. SUN039]UVO53010.1 hypothetical protein M0209_02335 [Sphingomonas sp. SUN039]
MTLIKPVWMTFLAAVALTMPRQAFSETPAEMYARGYAAARAGDRAMCVKALQDYLASGPAISNALRAQIQLQISLCSGVSIAQLPNISRSGSAMPNPRPPKIIINGHGTLGGARMTHSVN